jgi:hypothetical protein
MQLLQHTSFCCFVAAAAAATWKAQTIAYGSGQIPGSYQIFS